MGWNMGGTEEDAQLNKPHEIGSPRKDVVMIKKQWTRFLVTIVGVGLAVLFLGGCSEKADSGALKIGIIDPLTGPFAAYGEPVRDGIMLALDEINASGGIKGRKLSLVMEDDAGDPKNAVNAFTKLATVDKVPVVIGPLSSGASMATAPLADRYKVVQLSTLAGTIDLSKAGDYVFRIYPSSEIGSRYIAKVAVDKFKAKRVGILYPNNPFGVASRKFVSEVLGKAGVAIGAVETYNDGDRDFRTQLTKIAQAKPDVLMCSAYYEEGALILVQAHQLGLDVPVLGEDGWFGPIASIAGEALKNLSFANVAFGPDYADNQPMQAFITAFRKRYGREANSYSAAGYAAVYVVRQALEGGGHDGTGIRDLLYKTDMPTAFGRVKFDADGDNAGAEYALFQLNEKNEPVHLKQGE
jgi:branched-chain amino acid transport system substrate-binding protein